MTRRAVLIAVIVALAGLALAQKKEKKPIFPAWLTQARYVYVTTMYGDPFSANLRMPAEDRQAVADVGEALRKWGRFTQVYRPEQADVILLVRKGRAAEATLGGTISTGDPQRGTSKDAVLGSEAGSPEDALLVYDARLGTDAPAALKYMMKGGLNAPDVKLVAKFRKQVEEASAGKP